MEFRSRYGTIVVINGIYFREIFHINISLKKYILKRKAKDREQPKAKVDPNKLELKELFEFLYFLAIVYSI